MSVMRRWIAFICLASVPLVALAQKKGSGGAATSTSPSGSSSTSSTPAASSSAPIEEQALAFQSLDVIAKRIATQVCKREELSSAGADSARQQTIVIFDQTTFANIGAFVAFHANAKLLFAAYKGLATEFPSAEAGGDEGAQEVAAAQAFERTLTEVRKARLAQLQKTISTSTPRHNGAAIIGQTSIANLTRQSKLLQMTLNRTLDITLSSVEPFSDANTFLSTIANTSNAESAGSIVIPDSAVAVAVTRELKNPANGCAATPRIVYPPFFGSGSTSDDVLVDIQAEVQDVNDARDIALRDVRAAFGNTFGTGTGQSTTGNSVITTALTDVNGLYDSFMNSALQVNSSTGVIGSAAIAQGLQLTNMLSGYPDIATGKPTRPPAFILLASVVSMGGTEHDHKDFLRAITVGDQISYSAGLMVNVSLWQAAIPNTSGATGNQQPECGTSCAPSYADVLRFRIPFTKFKTPMPWAPQNGDSMSNNLSGTPDPTQP